ncbi:MAG: zinc-ribbon domain-containing protein [Eubacterium sp.]|nr:zinc-ribbon domain-containing protein [Eubacterium sp.]
MFCSNCGANVPDGSSVCPSCGANMTIQANDYQQYQGSYDQQYQNYDQAQYQQQQYQTYESSPVSSGAPASYGDELTIDRYASIKNLHDYFWAIAAYSGFIGVIMLAIMCPHSEKSEYLRFHMNQSLVLSIFMVAPSVLSFIPVVGAIVYFLWDIFCTVMLVIAIIGALRGRAKAALFFGKIRIIK